MKILLLIRLDAPEKNGGDLIQAKKYKEVIESSIPDVEVYMNYDLPLDDLTRIHWDFIFAFNIARIQEYSFLIDKLGYNQIFLVPILSPQFKFSIFNSFKSILRLLYKHDLSSTLNVSFAPAKYLKLFDGFVFLSKKEESAFNEKYRHLIKGESLSLICPNGVDFEKGLMDNYLTREIDFIVVGRVEKLKNSIGALQFRNKFFNDKTIVFIGAQNPYHKIYSKHFVNLINQSDAIYLNSISHKEVLSYMKNSKILLNLSLLECSPLVDLEALSHGCKVITTQYSYTHLVNSSDVLILDPLNVEKSLSKISEMLVVDRRSTIKQYNKWEITLIPLVMMLKGKTELFKQ